MPRAHPNWAGVIGRARRTNVKAFTERADLIIAVGYDPIEINYEEWVRQNAAHPYQQPSGGAGRRLKFLWNKACDLDAAIEALADMPAIQTNGRPQEFTEQRERWTRALRRVPLGFAPHQALDILREALPADGILAYDVGAHTHQIASQWRTDLPKTLLATNGWSSMGYGMPAAYAAKLVHPDRAVVCVVGDGGFQMTAGELSLARRLNLAVPMVVLNDGWLGLMKVKQEHSNNPLSGVHWASPPDRPRIISVFLVARQNIGGIPCRPRLGVPLNGPSVIEAFIDVESYSATVFD